MFSTFQKNRRAIGLLTVLFLLVGIHLILYSLNKVDKAEGVIVSMYVTILLATGGEIGFLSFKNLVLRIAFFLLLLPYIFILTLVIPVALSGWSNPSVPYTGSDVSSNYDVYLAAFPFAISILLFVGFIRVIGAIFDKD